MCDGRKLETSNQMKVELWFCLNMNHAEISYDIFCHALVKNVSPQHLIVILPCCGEYRPPKSMPVYVYTAIPNMTLSPVSLEFLCKYSTTKLV